MYLTSPDKIEEQSSRTYKTYEQPKQPKLFVYFVTCSFEQGKHAWKIINCPKAHNFAHLIKYTPHTFFMGSLPPSYLNFLFESLSLWFGGWWRKGLEFPSLWSHSVTKGQREHWEKSEQDSGTHCFLAFTWFALTGLPLSIAK